ncbi:uncharacterized protein ACBT44_008378 [Syngnathus typhle]
MSNSKEYVKIAVFLVQIQDPQCPARSQDGRTGEQRENNVFPLDLGGKRSKKWTAGLGLVVKRPDSNSVQKSDRVHSPDCLSEILAGAAVLYKLARRRRRGKRAGALKHFSLTAGRTIHRGSSPRSSWRLFTSHHTHGRVKPRRCWLTRANLAHELPKYRQHVTCPTRGAQTLDHCYTVIKDAYHSAARAALGLSDHCLVHLFPAYRQKIKTSKPVVRIVRRWTVESSQDLQACFDCTDWGAFEAATSDLHELTDTVTSYISFCEDLCVQTKTFCTYNNDKPWFTPNLRRLRKVKEEAYRSGDRALFRQTRNTLNQEVRKARCYGENLKRHLSANPDPSTVWKGLQSITGYKKRTPHPVESPRLANQLNRFYCRFDRSSHTTGLPAAQSTYSPLPTTALSTPLSSLSPTLSLAGAAPALQVREEEVRQMFRRQKTRTVCHLPA